ncbi:MAG TPA: hypothetical protein VGJ77_12305 [Gaiellaceae bacterium]
MTRLAVVALVAALAAPAAAAKTLRVNWIERKSFTDGGALVFRVTRITVTPASWSATVRIENRTRVDFGVYAGCTGFAPQNPSPGMAVVYYAGGLGWKTGTWIRGATTPLPKRLDGGASWSGTVGGRAWLPAATDLRLAFGYFKPLAAGPPAGCRKPFAMRAASTDEVFWITDHTFRP